MGRVTRWSLIVVLALVAALLLSACGDDRPCLKSHTQLMWVPIVHSTGKSTYVSYVFIPQTVCDEHVPEATK